MAEEKLLKSIADKYMPTMGKLYRGADVSDLEQIGFDLYLSHVAGSKYADQFRTGRTFPCAGGAQQ